MEKTRDEFIAWLYKKEFNSLLRKAYRMLRSEEAAKDIVQETFLLAVSRYEELVHHPNPGAWLSSVLNYLVLNELRRMKRRQSIPLDQVKDSIASEPVPPLAEMLPGELGSDDKAILTLRYEDKMSCREIGEKLGISEGASRTRLFRVMKKCKKYMRSEKK